MRLRSIVILVLAVVVAASALDLWRRPRREVEKGELEKGIELPPATEPTPLLPPSPMAAPALSEVQPTLDRVFGQTLTMDQAIQRAFVAGDFNGDDVTDLAVAVRPRSGDALSKLNAELTHWSVQDATVTTDTVSKPEPARVAAGDLLLAVVHGVDVGGWRNPDARQCYLVKNAVGSGMRLRPLSGVPAAIRMRANRTHVGDVVIVENRESEPALIFWTGAAYVWADLKPGDAAKASPARAKP